MDRMGLVLDTLKIQNVSDDVGYLNSIGRMRGAVVRQEARHRRGAGAGRRGRAEGDELMSAEVAKIDADLEIARQQYKKRIADATTQARGDDRGVARGRCSRRSRR